MHCGLCPAFAVRRAWPALGENRVRDDAEVLTAQEESQLEQAIDLVRDTYNFDVVILTRKTVNTNNLEVYAADYYEEYDYGWGDNKDGVMMMLVTGSSAGNRDMTIISHGRGEKVFDLEGIYDLEDEVLPYLRMDRFSAGLAQFVRSVESALQAHLPINRANRLLPIFAIAGALVGVMTAFILKGQLKTVRRKMDAASYVKEGSFHLTRSQDIFLYTTTTRRRIESSSSGGRGGGGGGFSSSSGGHYTGHSSKF